MQTYGIPNKRRKQDNNVTFYVYFDSIRYIIEHTPHITTETVETYKDIVIQSKDAPYVHASKKDPMHASGCQPTIC
jgi:hypothetical protein